MVYNTGSLYNKIYDDKSCKYDDKRYVICIVMCHSVSGDVSQVHARLVITYQVYAEFVIGHRKFP